MQGANRCCGCARARARTPHVQVVGEPAAVEPFWQGEHRSAGTVAAPFEKKLFAHAHCSALVEFVRPLLMPTRFASTLAHARHTNPAPPRPPATDVEARLKLDALQALQATGPLMAKAFAAADHAKVCVGPATPGCTHENV